MQFEFISRLLRARPVVPESVLVGGRQIRLAVVRNPRARRYILRVCPDGSARVTLPRGGSEAEARRFVTRHLPWLERQLLRQATRPVRPRTWLVGAEILLRGTPVRLEPGVNGSANEILLGDEVLRGANASVDWRPIICLLYTSPSPRD